MVRICTMTVMDDTDPDIRFDANGVCNHFYAARNRLESELLSPDEGPIQLSELAERIKASGRGKPYDCVLGLSGGADSSYVAVKAMEVGLRPLTVHLDNGWNTDTAVSNIESLLNHYDLDLHTHVIRWDQFRDLQRAFFKASVANVEVATDHAIFALLYHVAAEHGIRYILTGSNLETETIMPDSWGYDTRDTRHVFGIKRRFGNPAISLDTYPSLSPLKFADYILRQKIKFVPILNYGSYSKDNAVAQMERLFGYRKYARKHGESKFTRFFQEYYLIKKFNIDKRKAHLSSQIVSGMITRDKALEMLKMPLYNEDELQIDIEYVTKKLGFSVQEWEAIMQNNIKSYKDYPNNGFLFDQNSYLTKTIRDFAKRA